MTPNPTDSRPDGTLPAGDEVRSGETARPVDGRPAVRPPVGRALKRLAMLSCGIAVTVACLWWSLRGTDSESLLAAFAGANYLTLPLIWVLLAGFYLLKTQRWQWLLAPARPLTLRQLLPPMLIGFAANNLLPAHLGELVRVWVVRRKYGVPASTVLSTVVLERIFDVLAILALFGLGLMYSGEMPENYRRSALLLGVAATSVVMTVAVYLVWTSWFLATAERLAGWFPFLPAKLTSGLLQMLRTGADGLAALRSGTMILKLAINSLVQWLLNGMIAYLALKAFGIDVAMATGLVVTGVTAFGVTVPSTPGYFGVIQMCFQVSMAAQQVQPPAALVFGASVYYQLSMYIPVTVSGLYFLTQSGLTLRDLNRVGQEQDADSGNLTTTADQ